MSTLAPDRPRAPVPQRRRVSRQRYLARRIMVVVGLAALIVGVIKLVDAIGSSEDTSASDIDAEDITVDDTTPVETAGSVTQGVVGSDPSPTAPSEVTAAPETSVAPDTAAAVTGPPSAAAPARVLIAGDSDAGTFGPYLVTLLDQTGIVDTVLDYKVSSGLARPDFFNWPTYFEQQIPTVDPDIVVVTFGGNDAQGLSRADGSFIVGQASGEPGADAEWRAEYGRRVGEVMDYLGADGRTVIWVGIPNDDQDNFTARLAVLNEVVEEQVAAHPGVVFIDTWARFSGRDGNWAEYVIDPRDGQGKDVRAADGFHLNENGAEILALDIADAVREELRARGATI